ncbi:phytase B precursor [Limtongia smithiae]|uniref:phytase B precursor n=1 Tax=Limtongia smithiae TaxID=1125753 RepID=UPI0034CF91A9
MLFNSVALLAVAAASVVVASPAAYEEIPYKQQFHEQYSVLKHYGGNGPYSDRRGVGIDPETPAACAVDQVIYLGRHGERYPDPSTGASQEAALKVVFANNKTLTGSLAFANSWTYFVPTAGSFAQETTSGPYSGLMSAHKRGSYYRVKYGHLWDGSSIVPIFSSGYERIIETARYFGLGFFGYNYTTNAALNIISENSSQGANSLTPTCYTNSADANCELTSSPTLAIFNQTAARLNKENGLNLTATNAYYLMQLAAFELNARGSSPWIDVFTLDEWYSYGYTQDLQYYYCSGPGLNTTNSIGSVFANATMTLLNQGPSAGTLFFNFVHDTNITPVLSAMGILVPSQDLPLEYVPFPHIYSTGDMVPMGGHLVLERMTCSATATSDAGVYVRVKLNEAVVPFETCQDGPGYSCGLQDYTTMLQEILPDYTTRCEVPAAYSQYLTFFWDYNKTTSLDFNFNTVPYQESYTLN